ncbi:MAG: SH3 domain-containing protein [Alistipes sp.]|nr:SH3 domain-containing protein [Alistipes sp.]
MKKLFAILAVALLVVACGGGNTKKEEPKSIEDQLSEYLTKMEKAVKADNYEKAIDIYLAYEEWVDSLDEEQLKELKEVKEDMEGLGILDEVGSAYYEAGDDEADVSMVYSNCFDGYLNVRAEPSSKSKVVGTLRNGPEGAELLGVEGKWTKVSVNGVVGYIWSADTQYYPSDPVYIDASAVVGDWEWCDEYAHFDSCTIESKGDFYMSGYLSMEASGKWHLSGHNIILKYDNGKTIVCGVKDNALIINGYEYYK